MRHLYLLACNTLLLMSCAHTTSFNTTYKAHLDHHWYHSERSLLTQQLDRLTKNAQHYLTEQPSYNKQQTIHALVVPHAAYQYSGTIAATAYQRLDNPKAITRVIVLAPNHTGTLSGVATLLADGYQTPLGTLPIDTSAVHELSARTWCTSDATLFDNEHSLEVQLPLIQQTMPQAKLIPLLVGSLSYEQAQTIAATLRRLITPHTLVVVSSDFTHFGQSFNYTPFTTNIAQNIYYLDKTAIATLARGSYNEWDQFLSRTNATICGRDPLSLLMCLCESNAWGPTMLETISYDRSDRQTNNDSLSVSYTALALRSLQIAPNEKAYLLVRARAALIKAATTSRTAQFPSPDLGITHQAMGLFVTLHTTNETGKKKLRGCIGGLQKQKPLHQTVAEMTTAAALRDQRFTPVTPAELSNITISLSVLTPAQPIDRIEDIKLGIHGIILHHGGKQAVFLPEVPTEHHWNLSTTLSHLSLKAGLSSNIWQHPDTEFSVFESIKWSE